MQSKTDISFVQIFRTIKCKAESAIAKTLLLIESSFEKFVQNSPGRIGSEAEKFVRDGTRSPPKIFHLTPLTFSCNKWAKNVQVRNSSNDAILFSHEFQSKIEFLAEEIRRIVTF